MSSKEKDIEWVMNATGMNSKKARAALEKNNWQRERAVEERLRPSEDITDIFGSSDDEDEEFAGFANTQQSIDDSKDDQGSDNDNKNGDEVRGIHAKRKRRRILNDDEDDDEEDVGGGDAGENASDENSANASLATTSKKQKKKKIIYDSDEDAPGDHSNEGLQDRENVIKNSSKNIDDDDEDNEDQENASEVSGDKRKGSDDDKDDGKEKDEDEEDVDGDQDEEDEAVDGPALPELSNSEDESSDDEKRGGSQSNSLVYDFDIMMAKKKEENSRRRRKRDYDIINDNDDIIDDIIKQMKAAVDEDFQLNKNCMTATRKLKLLPFVVSQLRKVDLRDAFLDSGVLSVITDWLTPLPDRSLPHTNIRESLMKILLEFNIHDTDKIKASGIGKAIMYLYKHPKETKENKQRARQLISSWSRPIFQLDSSFSSMTREEREQRDLDLKNRSKRNSSIRTGDSDSEDPENSKSQSSTSQIPKSKESTPQAPNAAKPGDKGWIPRARVPTPSMKDYVIRPKSNIDAEISRNSKKQMNMLDKYLRSQQERKRASRVQRAVNMKIDRA